MTEHTHNPLTVWLSEPWIGSSVMYSVLQNTPSQGASLSCTFLGRMWLLWGEPEPTSQVRQLRASHWKDEHASECLTKGRKKKISSPAPKQERKEMR